MIDFIFGLVSSYYKFELEILDIMFIGKNWLTWGSIIFLILSSFLIYCAKVVEKDITSGDFWAICAFVFLLILSSPIILFIVFSLLPVVLFFGIAYFLSHIYVLPHKVILWFKGIIRKIKKVFHCYTPDELRKEISKLEDELASWVIK